MANHWLKQAQLRRKAVLPPRDKHTAPQSAARDDRGLLHLGELVGDVRAAHNIKAELSDADLLESLQQITALSDPRDRWLTAFNSPLGKLLASRGSDLNTALSSILSLLPPARS